MSASRFAAMLFDAGGVLVLPDPTVLGPLLAYYGGDASVDAHRRAHYKGMAAKSAAGSHEGFWHDYNLAYVRSVGIDEADVDEAAAVLDRTRGAAIWRWAIPESLTGLRALADAGMPMGVVSNASGQIEAVLARSSVCQVGDGAGVSMRVVIDSHIVGIAKPDPKIFEFAFEHFPGVEPSQIAYIGDSVTMDVGGARAAGMHPILVDPYGDHPGADFETVRTLLDLL